MSLVFATRRNNAKSGKYWASKMSITEYNDCPLEALFMVRIHAGQPFL